MSDSVAVTDRQTSPGGAGTRRRRLPAGLTVAGAVVAGLGFHWDIAWHTMFIRETFLTVPHVMIVCGLSLGLIAADIRYRRSRARSMWSAARGDSGAMLSLIATLVTFVALYLDNWWHTLFGFDVTLWSPPHLLLSLGFLLMLVGGIAELVAWEASPRSVAGVAGLAFAVATLLVFEYELGFLHRDLHWEPMALGLAMGCCLALAAGASRLVWAGTVAAIAALGFRFAGLALNALVGVALPTPPIGILLAGVAFDLARRWLARTNASFRVRTVTAALIAWIPMFVGTGSWRFLVGRTWWPLPVLPLGLGLGLLGATAGALVGVYLARFARPPTAPIDHPQVADAGASWTTRPNRWQVLRVLVVSLLVTGMIGMTGIAVLGETKGQSLQARLSQTDAELRLEVPGAIASDWTTILGGRSSDPNTTVWMGSLQWDSGAFLGPRPDENLAWLGVWYTGANRAWSWFGSPDTTGNILLEKHAFRPAHRPITPSDVIVSYVLILLLVTIPVGFIVLARERTRTEVLA